MSSQSESLSYSSSSSSISSNSLGILKQRNRNGFKNLSNPDSATSTPLANPNIDGAVVKERVTELVPVGESVDNQYKMGMKDYVNNELKDEVDINSNDINDNSSVFKNVPAKKKESSKRPRKQPAALKSVPKALSASVAPNASPSKRRTYTRKNKTNSAKSASVNVGEEVSILSSSSSGEFDRESINIMSSSSSSSSGSISSRSSVPSSHESLNSKSSKSSTVSESSTIEIVEEWEKIECPAIFENPKYVDPVNKYLTLKRRIVKFISINTDLTDDQIIQNFRHHFAIKALKQVLKILRKVPSREDKNKLSTKKSFKSGEKEGNQKLLEDYEFLKKMSTTSSGRKRKIRSEEGDWIDPNEVEGRVISHESQREKRKRKNVKKTNFEGYGGDNLSTTEDPFRLILLNDYHVHVHGHDHEHDHLEQSNEDYEILKAPFSVEICTSAILLMDLHSHLHSSEIIGLLGGTFIKTEDIPILRIDYGYPCLTAHSTGTQVDVDPLSEMEAGEFFERKNVRMTGWYHSHPNFEPNPSLRDLETQTMYQGLFRNSLPDSDIEPFVGVIVNPYLAITDSSSHFECFYVPPNNSDPSQERIPYRLPIKRRPFNPEIFPEILEKMMEIITRARNSPDCLDMQRNAEAGVKRIEKLYKSLQFHGDLIGDQMEQIKELFK